MSQSNNPSFTIMTFHCFWFSYSIFLLYHPIMENPCIPLILIIFLLPSDSQASSSPSSPKSTPSLRCEPFESFEHDPSRDLKDRMVNAPLSNLFPDPILNWNGPRNVTDQKAETTNTFAPPEDLPYYNYFAYAAYCPFPDSGFIPVEKCHPNKVIMRIPYCETITNEVTDTFAMLSWNKEKNEIVAAFRGSRSPQNVLLDIMMRRIKANSVEGLQVHNGFFRASKSIYNKTVARLKMIAKMVKPARITFTGHSLGGAMATNLLGMMFTYGDLEKGVTYRLITYGMPRVGNFVAADLVNSYGTEVTRVVSNKDVIPHYPTVTSPGAQGHFLHHRNEVWIRGNETIYCDAPTYEDADCSNSLDPEYHLVNDHLQYFDVYYGHTWAPPKFLRWFTKLMETYKQERERRKNRLRKHG